MTLPLGQISMSEVNVELGLSSTALISLNDAAVRTLAGVGGAGTIISMQDLQGKANQFAFTLSGSDVNLRTAALAAGWNGTTKVVATIPAPTTISSSTTATAALTINGAFPAGVDLINNGVIAGRGGNGGAGRSVSAPGLFPGPVGFSGGAALVVSVPVVITNNGTVAGGGGGGGGGAGQGYTNRGAFTAASGGGGGGRGGSTGGTGGTATPYGTAPQGSRPGSAGGPGSLPAAGGGGAGGTYGSGQVSGGAGGAGGGYGSGGSGGGNTSGGFGGGGTGGAGGTTGAAVNGNSFITWPNFGTRTGPIS